MLEKFGLWFVFMFLIEFQFQKSFVIIQLACFAQMEFSFFCRESPFLGLGFCMLVYSFISVQ